MEQNGRYARIFPLMWSVGLLIERRTIMAPGGRTGGLLVDVDIVCCCGVGELGGEIASATAYCYVLFVSHPDLGAGPQ